MSDPFAESFGRRNRMPFFEVVSSSFGSVAQRAGSGCHGFAGAHVEMRQRALIELSRRGDVLVARPRRLSVGMDLAHARPDGDHVSPAFAVA